MDVRNENNDLTVEESELIRDYKKAQNRVIPNVLSANEIWAMDFNQLDYPNLDYVSSLRQYLNELEPYMRGLVRVAYLRQLHYNEFYLGKKEEDEGHLYWRILMNAIAEDAVEKFNYWNKVHDDELADLVNEFERLTVAGEKEREKQYKREERARLREESKERAREEKEAERKTSSGRRRIESIAVDKEALRRAQLQEAERKRVEDEQLLNSLMEDKSKFVSGKPGKRRGKTIRPLDLISKLTALGYDAPWFSKFFRVGRVFRLNPGVIITGDSNTMVQLAIFLLTPYSYYSEVNVYKSGASNEDYEQYIARTPINPAQVDNPLYDTTNLDPMTVDISYDAIKVTLNYLVTHDENGLLAAALLLAMILMRASNSFQSPQSTILKIVTAEIFSLYLPDNSCKRLIQAINMSCNQIAKQYPDTIPILKIYLANVLVNWRYLSKLFALDYLSHPEFKKIASYQLRKGETIGQDLDLSCLEGFVPVIPIKSVRIISLWREFFDKFQKNVFE